MNIDKIFSIFETNEDLSTEDLLGSPYILLGTVIKGILSYPFVHNFYKHKYGETFSNLEADLKMNYFTGLFSYLGRIKEIDGETVSYLKEDFSEEVINQIFSEMLRYFEEKEYYEKCIIIKKNFDYFQEKVGTP